MNTQTRLAQFHGLAFGSDTLVGTISSPGEDQGMTVFAPRVVTGRELPVAIRQRKKNHLLAEPVNEEIEVRPPCPYFARCGGCSLQHLSLSEQRRLKLEMVRTAMARQLKIDLGERLRLVSDHQNGFHYRNRITLQVDATGLIGFYQRFSHALIPIEQCIIADHSVNELLRAIRALPQKAFDGIRQIELRGGSEQSLRISCIRKPPSSLQNYWEETLTSLASISFHRSLSDDRAPFRQVNSEANLFLASEIETHLRGDRVLELYSGDGNLTAAYLSRSEKVICVERNRALVQAAQARFKNEVQHQKLTLTCDSVERYLKKNPNLSPTVLLDPPRTGARGTCEILAQAAEVQKVLYVSCSLATWLRDCEILLRRGYRIDIVSLIDMFPQTNYIEIVSILSRT